MLQINRYVAWSEGGAGEQQLVHPRSPEVMAKSTGSQHGRVLAVWIKPAIIDCFFQACGASWAAEVELRVRWGERSPVP